MIRFLTQVDFCLSIVGLNYKGERRYKSPVGGVLSIVIFFLIVATSIYHLTNFFRRASPKFVLENRKYWNPPEYDISSNFTIAITTQYNGKTLFREDVMGIKAYYHHRENNTNIVREIETIPCKREDFIESESSFDVLFLQDAMCLNFTGISLQGTTLNEKFSYVTIMYSLCKGEKCHPDLKEFFSDEKPITYIYFLDTAFQTNNSTKRTRRYINFVEVNVTYLNSKETNVYFSRNELRVDDSYFFSRHPKQYLSFMIDSFRDLVSVRTDEQVDLLAINLLSSKNSEYLKISYMQLSELLANISALINVSVLIFTSIGEYINNFFFQNDVISALYSLKNQSFRMKRLREEILQNMKQKKDLNAEGDESPSKVADEFYFQKNREMLQRCKTGVNMVSPGLQNIINTSTESVNMSIPKIANNYVLSGGNNSLRLTTSASRHKRKKVKQVYIDKEFSIGELLIVALTSFLDPVRRCNNCGKTKDKYLLIQEKIFLNHDMINIYQKLQEIDILKYLLLNEEQLNMFRILPKPVLLMNKEEKQIRETTFSSFYNQKRFHYLKTNSELLEILKNGNPEKEHLLSMLNKENKTSTDIKLLKIFQERLFEEKNSICNDNSAM